MLVLFDASKWFIESSEWIALALRNESSGIAGDISGKQKKRLGETSLKVHGGSSGTRTPDLGIKSPLLYQLS